MKIRNIFAEIIYILAESKKKHTFEEIKINKKDFDISVVSIKMKAPNIHFGEIIFQEGDPKEIYIALNELAYHLTEEKNNLLACYWLEWLIEFDSLSKYKMIRRLYCKDSKFQLNLIWIVWEMFLYLAKEKGPLIEKMIYSLFSTASLGFKDQFYVDLSARNDWSSTLPAANRSYFYPSVSVSWLANTTFNLPDFISLFKIHPYDRLYKHI